MREKLLFDRGWRFHLGHAASVDLDFGYARANHSQKAAEGPGPSLVDFDDGKWRTLDLPHDWAIEQPYSNLKNDNLRAHGYHAVGDMHPEGSVGWYRRQFEIPAADEGRRIAVEFDGVFRDSVVWINGHYLDRHMSGYTGFRYDLTDFLNYGGRNVLTVRVDVSLHEGWFYEGAGIYRHVWLVKTEPVHVAPLGVCVRSELGGRSADVTVLTRLVNESDEPVVAELVTAFMGPNGRAASVARTTRKRLAPWAEVEVTQKTTIKDPKLWSVDTPSLYSLDTQVKCAGRRVDAVHTNFGIRTLRWDANKGFFLNGKSLKLKGVCCHQDHAGVGSALPDRLQEFRVERLKEMGCNAYRTSHNPPTPELLDACDRLGMLVMDEVRTSGSGPEHTRQLESLLLRDRNHPSVVIWSIGNEEHQIQGTVTGARIARTMKRIVRQLDPTRKITAAMNNGGAGDGFINVVDVQGWNYIVIGNMDEWHKQHPKQPIVGSEEASTLCTRGIYTNDPSRGYVTAYDANVPGWGKSAEAWWSFYDARPWVAGGFVWTGFDYRGEPTPYEWPCTNSHFGIIDLCGFPKDNFYYYKAWWTNEPVLHLFPHWNWAGREGQEIDVRCFSNCEAVELFLNGRSLGRQAVPKNSHVAWKVAYEAGAIEAHGFNGNRSVATTRIETSDEAANLVLNVDRPRVRADGEDVACLTVSATDRKGRPVPIADNVVRFDVSGQGQLIGTGSGDPSTHEMDKAPVRRMFNGLCMGLVQSTRQSGDIVVTVRADGRRPATLTIKAVKCSIRMAVR